ncbi:MAG: cytochrome P450 [Gammaproteobacteria bacterium]|jgi:cytochrome P450
MNWAELETKESWADVNPYDVPLDKIDMSRPELFAANVHHKWFERLRKEDPVHYCSGSLVGPYWSITRYEDIKFVDINHKSFSSEGQIVMGTIGEDFIPPQFIAMDQPKHDVQRRVVAPSAGPVNLKQLEGIIRDKACLILDSLPIGERFNWVDKVSIEMTTYMLAILFDFPMEDRHKLTRWSDVATALGTLGSFDITPEQREKELMECLVYFQNLWREREGNSDGFDFITMFANHPDTKDMIDDPLELLGNLILLIVGGNDTTRNSMSGGVLALNDFPEQYSLLKEKPELIPNMVSEIIRWQTPLSYMRRTALEDVELNGKLIKKGDQVIMWYVSGNRDDDVIERNDEFIIDRPNARQHLSFGFGIHRCMGNRVAELQLKIMWEEIMKRFSFVEVVDEPVRLPSNFVFGITDLPVVLHAH